MTSSKRPGGRPRPLGNPLRGPFGLRAAILLAAVGFSVLNLETFSGGIGAGLGDHRPATSAHPSPAVPARNDLNYTVSEMRPRAVAQAERCDPRNFLVLIKAASVAKYQKRRAEWRNSTCPTTYRQFNITYRFMLGLPLHSAMNPRSHDQNRRDNDFEVSDTSRIFNESEEHGDMEILSMRDVYDDIWLKELRIVEYAADRAMADSTSMVVLHDDEYCLRPEVLRDICVDDDAEASVYAGKYLWSTPWYDSQNGTDGRFAPYHTGWVYALSADLARDIAYDVRNKMAAMNWGHAGDLQMGVWVKNQADRKGRGRGVKYVVNDEIGWDVLEE